MLKPIKQIAEETGIASALAEALQNLAYYEARISPPPYGHSCRWCGDCVQRAKDDARAALNEYHIQTFDAQRARKIADHPHTAFNCIPCENVQCQLPHRDREGVCSSCGGRTVNGTCNARCDQ